MVVAARRAGLVLATDTVPDEFVGFTPYLATLLVLALASQRLRMHRRRTASPTGEGEAG